MSCKTSVLVAQWIEHLPGVRKVMDSNPIGTWIFFLGPTLVLHYFHKSSIANCKSLSLYIFTSFQIELGYFYYLC